MKKSTLFVAFISIALLAACGTKDVSFDTLEQAKNQANENALFNAQRFRQSNVLLQDNAIIPNGDSSQTPPCPQGDGWATLVLVSADKNKTD